MFEDNWTKEQVLIIVRFDADGKDKIAEMDLQQIACTELCEASDMHVAGVIRQENEHKPQEYVQSWAVIFPKIARYLGKINTVLVSHSIFHSSNEWVYVGKTLDNMGIVLTTVEEEEGEMSIDELNEYNAGMYPSCLEPLGGNTPEYLENNLDELEEQEKGYGESE